jgi:hypothetical protein
MKLSTRLLAPLALVACVQIKDAAPDSLRARIDTSNGLLAGAPARVDSTPASTTPRTLPPIGPDSTLTSRSFGTPEERAALLRDTVVALVAPGDLPSSPAARAAPAASGTAHVGDAELAADVASMRRTMQVPVAGFTPAMLHDSYDELRGGTRRHEALDILAARGTPVLAATGGRVLKLFTSKAGGLMVYAADSAERYILMYAHLDAYAPGLAAGQALHRGQPLGIVGTTGNAPANVPHLHFAMARSADVATWWKGTPVDPYLFLKP